jgi:hypothetical protein
VRDPSRNGETILIQLDAQSTNQPINGVGAWMVEVGIISGQTVSFKLVAGGFVFKPIHTLYQWLDLSPPNIHKTVMNNSG